MNRTLIAFVDTETCNSLDDPILYNIAMAICDTKGNIYDSCNFLIRDVFNGMWELMETAYYKEKIPEYYGQIASGEIELVSLDEAVFRIRAMIKKWGATIWCAHNARFDNASMNKTERYVTKSKYRFLMPYGMTAWDTLKMARDVIYPMPTYRKFCEENGYMTNHIVPRPQLKAEVIYKFITKDTDFVEEHKAMEDVNIEIAIMKYCFAKHKKMRKELWED